MSTISSMTRDTYTMYKMAQGGQKLFYSCSQRQPTQQLSRFL